MLEAIIYKYNVRFFSRLLNFKKYYVRHVLPKIFEADARQAPVSPSFLSI